jgi:Domain of unknown function (DUF4329)
MGCLKLDYYEDNRVRAHERTRSGEANMVLCWLSVDPLAEKYPSFNPYAYCYQNPINIIDPTGMEGEGPGDKFENLESAAKDFANSYNDNSIKDDKEYGTRFYEVYDSKSKETYYTYNEPNVGDNSTVGTYSNASQEGKLVAKGHTHAAYSKKFKNDEYSKTDKEDASKNKIKSFIATPNGSLLLYDPKTDAISVISTQLPSDESHPKRLNDINSKILPKNEPTSGKTDWIKNNIAKPLFKSFYRATKIKL